MVVQDDCGADTGEGDNELRETAEHGLGVRAGAKYIVRTLHRTV